MTIIGPERQCELRVEREELLLQSLEGVAGAEASKRRWAALHRMATARKHLAVFRPWETSYRTAEPKAPRAAASIEPPGYVPPADGIEVGSIVNRVYGVPQAWQDAYLAAKRPDEGGVGELMNIDLIGGSLPVVRCRHDNTMPGGNRAETKVETAGSVVAGTDAVEALDAAMFDLVEPTFSELTRFLGAAQAHALSHSTGFDWLQREMVRWVAAFVTKRRAAVVHRNFTRKALEELVGTMRAAEKLAFDLDMPLSLRLTPEELYETFVARMHASRCFPRYTMVISAARDRFILLENGFIDNVVRWEGKSKHGVKFSVSCFDQPASEDAMLLLPPPRLQLINDHVAAIRAFRVSRKQAPAASRRRAASASPQL